MKITAAEGEILKVLWRVDGPMTADEVIAQAGDHLWSPRTVRTFLARLVKANAVGVQRQVGGYVYQAAVGWSDYAHREIRSLLERLFDGSVASLVEHLSLQQDLGRHELAELQELMLTLSQAGVSATGRCAVIGVERCLDDSPQ